MPRFCGLLRYAPAEGSPATYIDRCCISNPTQRALRKAKPAPTWGGGDSRQNIIHTYMGGTTQHGKHSVSPSLDFPSRSLTCTNSPPHTPIYNNSLYCCYPSFLILISKTRTFILFPWAFFFLLFFFFHFASPLPPAPSFFQLPSPSRNPPCIPTSHRLCLATEKGNAFWMSDAATGCSPPR